mgnify:CR=1 FL=1
MIDFDRLDRDISKMKMAFSSAIPFEHIVIDEFCNANLLDKALDSLPDAHAAGHNKSNDYIFAKNKFEKSEFDTLSPQFSQLKTELMSSRFEVWLSELTGQKIFIDQGFHGGGLHPWLANLDINAVIDMSDEEVKQAKERYENNS